MRTWHALALFLGASALASGCFRVHGIDEAAPRDGGILFDVGADALGTDATFLGPDRCIEPRRSVRVSTRESPGMPHLGVCDGPSFRAFVVGYEERPDTQGIGVQLHLATERCLSEGGADCTCTMLVDGVGADLAGALQVPVGAVEVQHHGAELLLSAIPRCGPAERCAPVLVFHAWSGSIGGLLSAPLGPRVRRGESVCVDSDGAPYFALEVYDGADMLVLYDFGAIRRLGSTAFDARLLAHGHTGCGPDADCDLDAGAVVWASNDRDGDGFDERVDCHDQDPEIHPMAADACCDGRDTDCDGRDNPIPDPCFCVDSDNDGDGVTAFEGDCNDQDPNISPRAEEICGDGIDQDCNLYDYPAAGVCPDRW